MELLTGASMLFIILVLGAITFAASRYKRCPSNKVIVVYGKVQGSGTAKCVHGGGVFVLLFNSGLFNVVIGTHDNRH